MVINLPLHKLLWGSLQNILYFTNQHEWNNENQLICTQTHTAPQLTNSHILPCSSTAAQYIHKCIFNGNV